MTAFPKSILTILTMTTLTTICHRLNTNVVLLRCI